MKKLLIDLHYLPCIEYFCQLIKYKQIVIEAKEYFIKQSCRNRCYILSANKVQMLSIPVKRKTIGIYYKDIQIDYDQKWLNNHWNAIKAAYGKAPYFEFYAEFFRKIFFKKIKYLFDLNIEMLDLCLKLLMVKCEIEFTECFNKISANNTNDMRGIFHPISKLPSQSPRNPGGRNNHLITKSKYLLKPYKYQQLFGTEFTPNLSIIDLLFCAGGDSLRVLKMPQRH